MNYQLYYADQSAAMGVRVILEEIGLDYELIMTEISPNSPRGSELLRFNPNGWIPVLLTGNLSMYECGAITVFLCDRHSEAKLAPTPLEPERMRFLQWIFFFSSSLQNAYQMTYYSDRFCNSANEESSVKQRSRSRLSELWSVVDEAIGNDAWMLGHNFSAADIYLFMLTTWLSELYDHPKLNTFPNVKRIAGKVMQRSSVELVYSSYISQFSD